MTPAPGSRPKPAAGRSPAPASAPAAAGPPTWLATLVIFACVFALYGNTIGHDFSGDDPMYTLQNRFVQRGFAGAGDILTKGSMVGYDGTVVGPYRPVMLLSYLPTIAVSGNDPHAHHLMNVLLYALLGVLLYRLLRQMLGERERPLALLVTLLYLFHPVHTEVVASIKSRDEILAWMFGILAFSLLLDHARRPGRARLAGSALCFLLALLSKENAVTFLLVAPLLLWFFTRVRVRTIALAVVPWGVALAVYLAMRLGVQGVLMSNEQVLSNNALIAARNGGERLATSFAMLGRYLVLLVFPRDLTWDYSYNQIPIVGWGHWSAWGSAAVYTGLAVAAVALFRRRSAFSFAILFYALTLSVVANVFFLLAATMGERFLFTPSFGFALALGLALWHGLGPGRARGGSRLPLYAVTAAILLAAGTRTVIRNRDWRDSYTLDEAGVKVSTHSARAHGAMGTQYATRGDAETDPVRRTRLRESALAEYRTMTSINPGDADGWLGCGLMTMALGDSAGARDLFREALRLRPRDARSLVSMGVIFFRAEKLDSASYYFSRAAEADSLSAEAYGNLGAVALVRGDARSALGYFDRALRLEPFKPNVLANRRKAYLMLGDTVGANASVGPASLAPR